MVVNWRKIFTSPYSDKTHFIYELIQNADDSKSKHLELQLRENELIVWNDGRQFTKKDVDSICSIGFSNKDLTQIGTFGMGITAVFTYTDCLEVYSGDRYFRIKIKDPTKRENIDFDEIDSTITEQLNKGKTVFRLPFRKKLRQEDIEKLRDRLCNLAERRPLLFLRHLERIVWRNELGTQIGSYFCHRCPHDKMQDASEVELTTSLDDNNQRTETFLVFNKKAQPPQDVIDELLYQAEDDTEQQRIQQSVKKPQPTEVAFRLQNSRITVMADKCMLFSYLSTQKETHLRFIIQARYQTTLARENIEDIEDNLWNRWLVRETANFLPEVLEQLKSGGLLEPAFFDVLPLKKELEKAFKPIAKTLRKAMRERLLVPTQDGAYTKSESVLYPHDELLREFIESSWLHPNSSWLHPDIQDKEEFRRRFTFMQDSGVNIISFRRMLRWLEEQDSGWFESKSNEWLRYLYTYLNKHQSELERIKKLPLIRLENGRHVCASEAFFPPKTDEEHEEIAPFLNELPILQSALLEGEGHNDIKDFLDDIGVEVLRPEKLINQSICPLYSQPNKPSIMKNRRHVRYIFKSWQKVTESERSGLEESINGVPILRAYKGIQRKTFDFVVPCNAYLPQAYTGDNDLETYFSIFDGNLWFVDDKYLTNKSDTKAWLQFLKAIGAMDTPQIIDVEVSGDSEECKKRGIAYENSTKSFEDGEFKYVWSRYRYFDGHIVDRILDGLPEVLAQIGNRNEIDLSQALWGLLVKLVNPLPSEKWQQNAFFKKFFQGTYRWFYRTDLSKSFDAAFYRQLESTAWMPDEQGNLHSPDECFVPTSENQEILGDSVTYLHSDFDMSTQPAQWLAKKLEIKLKADPDGVLDYLQILSQTETNIEKIEPIYEFLWLKDERLSRFEEEPLIFTSNPEPRWWRADEVFWEDESAVFGDDRGYLKAHYSEDLKSFFTTSLRVPKRADTLDYVRGIQDITSKMQAGTKEIRDRVQKLYRRLWFSIQENGDSLEGEDWQEEWEQIREDACWLGKKGDEWSFFSPQELVWNDHPYLARIFEGKIPFWGFSDELLELAKDSGIEGCSQALVECLPLGDQEDDEVWSRKVQDICSCLDAFLKSPSLCDISVEGKSDEVLSQLSVRRVEELEVTYELNGISVIDIEARQSFLSKTNQGGTFWLALEAKEDEYAELIGDASQDYFGVKELRGFVEDLLTKDRSRVLTRWKRDGLRVDLCEPTPEMDSKESEEISSESVDERFPGEPSSEENSGISDSGVETPTIHEEPETGNEDNDSTGNGSETPTHRPRLDGGGARRRGGKAINTPSGNRDLGYSSSRSGDNGGETHMEATDTSPHARKEIENIGMEHARRHEKKQGRTPKDVSSENRGYDIYSTSPDGKIRCIEVKARSDHGFVVLTSNEWSTAQQFKDDYFLYVVLNAIPQPELYIIRNPADVVRAVEQIDVRYQVPVSEITEHGIRV